jgi:selenium-binding protein 1
MTCASPCARPAYFNEQFLRAFRWDDHELKAAFEIDFTKEQLGRPHHMKFSANPPRLASLTDKSGS